MRVAPALEWAVRAIAVAGLVVVAWCCLTAWPAIVHGYPLYAALLALTVLGCVLAGWRSTRRARTTTSGWRLAGRIVLVVAALGWVALMAWLRPFSAVQPALAAMGSDGQVIVAEHATQIVLTPTGRVRRTGVFFQPGARVDARAYAAVLRPLAEAGFTVVIPKQPLGIAFLSTQAFESTRAAYPRISRWVVGGHSLGGTVAAIDAAAHDQDATAPVVGLFFYASFPASDLHTSLTSKVLSISGSNDGLATPAKIEASRANLPADARFLTIDGAVHAYFGDYGPQPGDGTPTITHDRARAQISADSVRFVKGLDASP